MSILVGGVLFLMAFPLLFWNEGRAVQRAQILEQGRGQVIERLSNLVVDPDNDGKLVHLQGLASSGGNLADELFTYAENINTMLL